MGALAGGDGDHWGGPQQRGSTAFLSFFYWKCRNEWELPLRIHDFLLKNGDYFVGGGAAEQLAAVSRAAWRCGGTVWI